MLFWVCTPMSPRGLWCSVGPKHRAWRLQCSSQNTGGFANQLVTLTMITLLLCVLQLINL